MSENTAILVGLLLATLFYVCVYAITNIIFWAVSYFSKLWGNRGGGWRKRTRNRHRAKLGLPKLK